jgi:DNA invertase Pin-like site-specific DNA recombinase
MTKKILGVKRISRDSETSSSLKRQELDIRAEVAKRDAQLVHMVEDATVSGAVNLDERKSLGDWLREPLVHEWQTMMVTTQDRITRDDMHWWQFVGWVLKHQKTVVVLDDPSLDLSTEDGRMIAGIKASQASRYRTVIKEKRLKQLEYYREVDLWPGGRWPYGYRAEVFEFEGRKRWRLVLDPETSELVREAYRHIVDANGVPYEVVKLWNSTGVLTAQDHQRHINSLSSREKVVKEVRGTQWTEDALRKVLRKPSLMGYAVHKGVIRRRDGKPVQWAEPLLSAAEFKKLQAALSSRARGVKGRKYNVWPLTGLLVCACGHAMYSNTQKGGTAHYVCGTRVRHLECEYRKTWNLEYIQDSIDDIIIGEIGDLEIQVRHFVPGVDHAAEIEELESSIDNLSQSLTRLRGAAAERSIVLLNEYSDELSRLQAQPTTETTHKDVGTGKTYADEWQGSTWEEKAKILRRAEITFTLYYSSEQPVILAQWSDNLRERLAAR